MKKKFIILVFAVLLISVLTISVSALTSTTSEVNDVSGYRGDTATFTATLAEAVTVRSGSVELSYDKAVLQLVSGEWNISGTMMSPFDVNTGKGAFVYSSGTEISDTIFTATFKILDNAAMGSGDVALTIALRDADKNDVAITNHSGSITVNCKHSFTSETATDEYLKSAATCTARAVYYKSCSICGEKGTDTFEFENPLSHEWSTNENENESEEETCNACGEVNTEEDKPNPNNIMGIGVGISIFIVTIAVVIGVLILLKRKRRK